MPTHPRQQIREAVKAALVAASTAAGSRVYESRGIPWGMGELPAISVYSLNEQVDEGSRTTAPRELDRTVNVAVDLVVSVPAQGAVDDVLDALALQVENAMHADRTLGGVASDLMLISTEMGTVEGGQRPIAAAQLVYAVQYFTLAPEPSAPENLEAASVTHDLGGEVHPDNQARDQVEDLDQ